MSHEDILVETGDRIATITLNRPDKLNAWTPAMEREVREAMEAADCDDAVRVIVLTGAGRGFCAGADMAVLNTIRTEAGDRAPRPLGTRPFDVSVPPDYQTRYSYFPAVSKPVIGAINGPAAGLGMVMALYCDIRIAGADAVFSTAFSKRGLIAEHGISWMLPRLIGLAAALDLLLSSRKVGAEEALRLGLVNRVVPQAELMTEVRAYAADLAQNVSPRSMAVMKRQVYAAQFETLAEAVAVGNREMAESFRSEDFREGVAHFVEKRQANFTGR
ncbi:enoyl-CoA hydratase [Oceanibacterium hippocampi]|uniref:Putative enoyl-CoA hydratase echA8 n=1 Tax=Oceanibacterium hippocampi TaxID=745714 RepID=A0A1Y5TY57_9PROT|nr:enoyl-CoA hydratase [Oceanibacterium hippocampi]SLN76718.1 putative enoyl-CoA hydratase echA8 [Oceanibacterium hippocampi]